VSGVSGSVQSPTEEGKKGIQIQRKVEKRGGGGTQGPPGMQRVGEGGREEGKKEFRGRGGKKIGRRTVEGRNGMRAAQK